jgi:hypothetical protein
MYMSIKYINYHLSSFVLVTIVYIIYIFSLFTVKYLVCISYNLMRVRLMCVVAVSTATCSLESQNIAFTDNVPTKLFLSVGIGEYVLNIFLKYWNNFKGHKPIVKRLDLISGDASNGVAKDAHSESAFNVHLVMHRLQYFRTPEGPVQMSPFAIVHGWGKNITETHANSRR